MDSTTYFEKDLRKLKEFDDTYNMPRENEFDIGRKKLRQWEKIGNKVR